VAQVEQSIRYVCLCVCLSVATITVLFNCGELVHIDTATYATFEGQGHRVIGHNSRSQERNAAKVVGATSSEGF